jgi:WD repeat-containing protein 48
MVITKYLWSVLLQVPVYKEPSLVIPGVPAIIQHEIMNNRRHVLTKVITKFLLHVLLLIQLQGLASWCMHPSPFLQDTAGSVKLWEITRGAVIEDFGKVFVLLIFLDDCSLKNIYVHVSY